MTKYYLDQEKYKSLARQAAAEGCVLLRNEGNVLPLKQDDKVAVFGRIAHTYYKSGLGSGGLVNTRYVIGILDALRAEESIVLDEELLGVYEKWIEKNPFDEGKGWGQVPWCQQEMPLENEVIAATKSDDIALVVVGRTAGEDQDNKDEAGSYQLTELEYDMIRKVRQTHDRMAVVLNVGNIIDMNWVNELDVPAVIYVWQGGQEGGNAVADVLTGRVNPCGKLNDTIAYHISDHSSDKNFGDRARNYYEEDIYMGYRYFETFAKDKVMYPFGYGLSYTTFDMKGSVAAVNEKSVDVQIEVKNTGSVAGKEVAQIYVEAPQGKLGKPSRVLVGFHKTGELAPGEEETTVVSVGKDRFASYDDSGVSGHESCFVLEQGEYKFYVGSDVRVASCIGQYEEAETLVVEALKEACRPVLPMKRMRPALKADGSGYEVAYEDTPLRTVNPADTRKKMMKEDIPFTGDKGHKLVDVLDGKVSMETFVAQLTDDELIQMFRGEGMCSPKVTAGCGGAFGGLSKSLQNYGIPATCCTDGPSGIRMDCGSKAFAMPNGAALACSFNLPLVQELYHMNGLEMRKNRIDLLLGPGMNIHRHPLNGRNFEYFSEDPLVTGLMAVAQLKGCEDTDTTLTIKHFATNNQEWKRQWVDAVVSERALREIYLKVFEIAVREGNARAVMTTYAPMNGIWTSSHFDLNTVVLREQWGFDGIVMSDWWALGNTEGEEGTKENRAPMVAAQNDMFMVTMDATDMSQDNVKQALEDGVITRYELQRNAMNILGFILKSPAILHETGRISKEELAEMKERDDDDFSPDDMVYYEVDEKDEIIIDGKNFRTDKGCAEVFGISVQKFGIYDIELKCKSDLEELAQLSVAVYCDNIIKTMFALQGSNGQWKSVTNELGFVFGQTHFIKLYFGASGLEIDQVVIRLVEEQEFVFATENE